MATLIDVTWLCPRGAECEVVGCDLDHPLELTTSTPLEPYFVVFNYCDACGIVNEHLTADCPFAQSAIA